MKCAIIIQARSDSNRFPRKVFAKIEEKPMLWHIINRLKLIDDCNIVVATTAREIDNEIVNIAKKSSVKYFRGNTKDVLDRYYMTAKKFEVDIIMRITADCPLIDPIESEKVLKKLVNGGFDYVSNGNETYPDGLDTECFSFNVLKKAWANAKLGSEREHVTPYIWKNSKIFKIGSVKTTKNMKEHRWTVDHKEDIIFVRKIYSKIYKKNKIFLMKDILEVLKKEPSLMQINSMYNRNEGYKISLKND